MQVLENTLEICTPSPVQKYCFIILFTNNEGNAKNTSPFNRQKFLFPIVEIKNIYFYEVAVIYHLRAWELKNSMYSDCWVLQFLSNADRFHCLEESVAVFLKQHHRCFELWMTFCSGLLWPSLYKEWLERGHLITVAWSFANLPSFFFCQLAVIAEITKYFVIRLSWSLQFIVTVGSFWKPH